MMNRVDRVMTSHSHTLLRATQELQELGIFEFVDIQMQETVTRVRWSNYIANLCEECRSCTQSYIMQHLTTDERADGFSCQSERKKHVYSLYGYKLHP